MVLIKKSNQKLIKFGRVNLINYLSNQCNQHQQYDFEQMAEQEIKARNNFLTGRKFNILYPKWLVSQSYFAGL